MTAASDAVRAVARAAGRLTACTVALALASGCALFAPDDPDGRVTIEFFQFKPEAIETFNKIIVDFEREHPDIRVRQNHVPDAETAIRTRLVRDDVPDVMTLNANATFAELAQAGVFYDFSAQPAARRVSPAYLKILGDLGSRGDGEVNALPLAANAGGIIYNADLFARHGVEPPTTWAEFIAAAETFRRAGVTPLYLTLKDAWTALAPFNALASSLPPRDFFDRRRAGDTSFREGYTDVAARLYQLSEFGQDNRASRDYNSGNQAFAKGEAAMYPQGTWALPTIRSFKPGFDIGTFPVPMDDPSATTLVSGVDVAVTMAREPRHREQSLAFVNYLLRPAVVTAYAKEQSAIPTLADSVPTDPALAGLAPYVEQGRLVGFADHQIPPAIPLAPLTQQFLIDGDRAGYLGTLDREWDKVARRRR
jgi:raffinose/stachyose/melibiose transport system substrate-binding protein